MEVVNMKDVCKTCFWKNPKTCKMCDENKEEVKWK